MRKSLVSLAVFVIALLPLRIGAHEEHEQHSPPAPETLGKGDCLYFSGETPHEVRSLGRQKAEVLVVVAQTP